MRSNLGSNTRLREKEHEMTTGFLPPDLYKKKNIRQEPQRMDPENLKRVLQNLEAGKHQRSRSHLYGTLMPMLDKIQPTFNAKRGSLPVKKYKIRGNLASV